MTKTKLAFVRCRLSCFSRRPVRFFPRLFPFACLLLFACRRFRCPALGLAGFFPRRIFRYRLSVFLSSFPSRRPVRFFPVFSLLPVCCCSPVVVFAVRHWDLPAFSRGGFFAIVFLFFFIVFSFPPSGLLFSPSFPFCRYFPSLFVFSFVAFCIWSFFSAFFFSFFSVLFFLFYREAASGRKTGGHGRRMALKLFLPMARQKETPPKRGKFYK